VCILLELKLLVGSPFFEEPDSLEVVEKRKKRFAAVRFCYTEFVCCCRDGINYNITKTFCSLMSR
jgi:hypothetical protein